MTRQTVTILEVLLENPDARFFGLEIVRSTTLKTGTVYPILARLEAAGWLESRWEPGDASDLQRPLRRMYQLTGVGQLGAPNAIERYLREREVPVLDRRPGRVPRPGTA